MLAKITLAKEPAEYLVSFHPTHPQFEALRLKLAELRKATARPEEAAVIVPPGPLLKPGMRHPDIVSLRQRLKVSLPAGADPFDGELYDEFLEEAVRNFQIAEGLKPDGLVGKTVRAKLNGSEPESQSAQIERVLVNMERWRWLPSDLGGLYIWNNIPEFLTRVMKDGAPIFEERIVVGKPKTPTPIFSDVMEYVEFHPFWNVPDSIKQNELLPGLMSGRDPLARQGLVAKYKGRTVDPYSVDWSTVDIKRFHIYQPPGRGNALGIIKFMFPNKHDVYMHDTPSKSLFNASVRAFSHGCMRVRNPLKFAEVVLGEGFGLGTQGDRPAHRPGREPTGPFQQEDPDPRHLLHGLCEGGRRSCLPQRPLRPRQAADGGPQWRRADVRGGVRRTRRDGRHLRDSGAAAEAEENPHCRERRRSGRQHHQAEEEARRRRHLAALRRPVRFCYLP